MDTYILHSIKKLDKPDKSGLDEWEISFFDGNLKANFHQHGENQATGCFQIGENSFKSVVLENTSNKPINEWKEGDSLIVVFYDIRTIE